MQDAIDQIAKFLDAPLLVRDIDGSPIAASGRFPAMQPEALANITSLARQAQGPVYTDRVWAAPLCAGGDRLGDVLLFSDADLGEARMRLFGWLAQFIALLLFTHHSIAEAEARLRRELLDELLTGRPPHPVRLRKRARWIGVDPDLPYVLLVVRPGTRLDRIRAAGWLAMYAARHCGMRTEHDDKAVVLVHGDDPGVVARYVAERLSQVIGDPVTVGAAGPSTGMDSIPALFREAQRCAEALVVLGRSGSGAAAQELGFIGMLMANPPNVSQYVQDMLGMVMAYDARRGTKLLETLDAYFAAGGSPSKTAQLLHLHVNTVTRRLERISRMLGKDWREPDHALELQVALRLHRMRHAL